MKQLLLLLALASFSFAAAQSPLGYWKTIDDETKKAKSIVHIWESDGKLYGRVAQLLNREPGDENPMCDECDGDLQGKPILGMRILWDMEPDDDEWDDGKIMDPASGSVYSCEMELQTADKLKVRGYVGFSLLGRTQYWYRVPKPAGYTPVGE